MRDFKESFFKLLYAKYHIAKLLFVGWHRKSKSFKYQGIESLSDLRVINVRGYNYSNSLPTYQKFLDKKKDVIILSGNNPVARTFQMIDLNRADIFVMDTDTAKFVLKKLELADKFSSFIIEKNYFISQFGVPLKNKRAAYLVKKYDEGFKKLKESGELRKILKKYDVEYVE